jgi:hypothetical protein
LVWILWNMPVEPLSAEAALANSTRRLSLVSLLFPLWYLGTSWIISVRLWRKKRRHLRRRRKAAMSGEFETA